MRLLPLIAAVSLATCGDDDATTTTSSPNASDNQLTVTVWPEGRDAGQATEETFTCPGDAAKPCAIITAWEPETLAPTPSQTACTEIYGGPQEARIAGTLDGERVDETFSRANGCEIERFDRVSELLEQVVPGITSIPVDAGQQPPGSDEANGNPRDPVESLVTGYVQALNDHDGDTLCSLFAPGALDGLDLPEARGGCGASLSASIGYEDPRGLPAWESSRILAFPAVRVTGTQARATTTIRTIYAGRADEPSIEDDVIYLSRAGGGWLLAKPSLTLYRAIGTADIPPDALAPPA